MRLCPVRRRPNLDEEDVFFVVIEARPPSKKVFIWTDQRKSNALHLACIIHKQMAKAICLQWSASQPDIH